MPCVTPQIVVHPSNIQLDLLEYSTSEGGTEEKQMMKPMTKAQLVAALAEKMGSDKKTAAGALDALSNLINEEVGKGGAVASPGVGKILCRARPERMVRNPATGEQVKKPADKVVKMTIAKSLKDSVNG
jgi:DNA-binding protein HU-beta